MLTQSVFIKNLPAPFHPSWNEFIKSSLDELLKIERQIVNEGNYTPDFTKVLRFLTLDLFSFKIIILGQDPYPQPGVATGRAFEVGGLYSWHNKFSNISLKNIVRAIYSAYEGKIIKFSEILPKIEDSLVLFKTDGSFSILPPNKLFKSWEEQGVLLLNTAFTCKTGYPGSHSHIWNSFSRNLLKYIVHKNEKLIWFIWGNHAADVTRDFLIKHKYVSMHPMMCYNNPERGNDFLFGSINQFFETKEIINWKGC